MSTSKDQNSDPKSAEQSQGEKPWGKLTSFNVTLDNVNLIKDTYSIGRNSTNDIAIVDIRLSGIHCKIYRNEDGECWIEDLSSNGTYIENEKIGKGNKRKLCSGDKIYLLHMSKVKQEEALGYVFSANHEDASALKRKREEEEKAIEEARKINEKQQKFQEELGEEMQCVICIDYIYQCVTLIPCLHNFCAACLSDWIEKSSACPNCREEIIEIKKNATVNNIIEKFMENNPSKKRPKEEYEEMDKKNQLKEDKINLAEFKRKKNPQPQLGGLFGPSLFRPQPSGGLFQNLNNVLQTNHLFFNSPPNLPYRMNNNNIYNSGGLFSNQSSIFNRQIAPQNNNSRYCIENIT